MVDRGGLHAAAVGRPRSGNRRRPFILAAPVQERLPPDQRVIPILGIVLLSLSLGAMVVIYLNSAGSHFWTATTGLILAPLVLAVTARWATRLNRLNRKPATGS